jgi:hypothetical protein
LPTTPPEALGHAVVLAETVLGHMRTDPLTQAQCWWRNAAVVPACAAYGIEAREVIGPAIYQAGAGRDDCIPFCGADNEVMRHPFGGGGLFHFWGEADIDGETWVIDLSTGEWKAQEDGAAGALDRAMGMTPINWLQPTPVRLVAPKWAVSTLSTWKQPPMGCFWYGKEAADAEQFREGIEQTLGNVRGLIVMLIRNHGERMPHVDGELHPYGETQSLTK